MTAPQSAPTNGILTSDAQIHLVIDSELQLDITLPAAWTDGSEEGAQANASVQDLVTDLNRALDKAGVLDRVTATIDGSHIIFSTTSAGPDSQLALSYPPGNVGAVQLGFPQSNPPVANGADGLSRSTVFTGLTIDSPTDVDFYLFEWTGGAFDQDLDDEFVRR